VPAFLVWFSRLLPTNPIVIRLVEGGGRRTRDLYLRSGYLGILAVVLIFGLIGPTTTMKDLAQRGANAFTIIAFGQVALICLLTPVFMAGAIAQESNPRTWDILLTTPLNNLQIVLGTLFGRLFFILALLVSTLPLFATTQLFGGVPPLAVVLSYAIAVSSAILVGAIAVTLSVTRSAGKRAVFVFYITVVMYLFITYAADIAARKANPVGVGTGAFETTWLTPLNPFLALEALLLPNTYAIPSTAGRGALAAWWMGHPVAAFCWTCLVISGVMILWATVRLRVIGTRGAYIPWWRKLLQPRTPTGEREPRTVGTNPIAWRERTARFSSAFGLFGRWAFAAAGFLAGLLIVVLYHVGFLAPGEFQLALLTTVIAEVVIVSLTAINLSGTAVSREREDGTLDLLLTTPIQPGPYLAGKLQGLVQYLLPMILVPFVTLGAASIYVLAGGFGTEQPLVVSATVGTATVPVPIVLPEAAIEVTVVLVAFVAFCVMVGLQWSIKSKGTIGSVIAAFGVVVLVGGTLGACGAVSGRSIPVVGAVITALSPVNLALAAISPETVLWGGSADLAGARTGLAVGSVLAAAGYFGAVFGMHAAMKRTFMMTVRRLAGTN
jgi:ABC-type transport system involved in multi-copper enzyme maturation permease subunit